MTQGDIVKILKKDRVLLTDGHYVYTEGGHSTMYFDKNQLFIHTDDTSRICREIAQRFAHDNIQVVVGPAVGGAVLSQWTAHHLSLMVGHEVLSVYAERHDGTLQMRRGYDKVIVGKRVLVVEDTLSTGKSARDVINAVHNCEGEVIGLGAINNGGNITAKALGGVTKLSALVSIRAQRYEVEVCPMCESRVPIALHLGHGHEFKKTHPEYPGGFVEM